MNQFAILSITEPLQPIVLTHTRDNSLLAHRELRDPETLTGYTVTPPGLSTNLAIQLDDMRCVCGYNVRVCVCVRLRFDGTGWLLVRISINDRAIAESAQHSRMQSRLEMVCAKNYGKVQW